VPVVFNGVVYLSSANYDDNAKSSSPLGSIFAIDALRAIDGIRNWHVQMTGYGYAPAPVVVGSTLCLAILAAGLNPMHIYGLSLADGHTKWQDAVPSNLSTYPAFQTGDAATLYTSVAQQGSQASGVAARNATNGTTVWQTALAEYGVLVVSNRTLFDLGSPSLYAVQTDTGTVLWHTDQYRSAIAITVGSKKLYLGTGDGMVWALSAGDGHRVWQARVSGAAVDDLTATSDGVFVSSTGGYLDAFAAGDGARIWSARIDQQHPSPPAIGP
jgi:hypothetical protein